MAYINILFFISLGIILSIVIFFIPFFIPILFDSVFGESIINQHKNYLIGNETNSTLVAQKLMSWVKNSTTLVGEKTYFTGFMWGIFNVNGQPILFIRNNCASWFIVTRVGNCGEEASYFVELMNRSGFYSRKISADLVKHAWAEYYDNGKKIIVDPSKNFFINDTFAVSDQEWTNIEAVDLAGNTENVTKEYILKINKSN